MSEHIEYVPAQILMEYPWKKVAFDGSALDGIVKRSPAPWPVSRGVQVSVGARSVAVSVAPASECDCSPRRTTVLALA